jgi:formyl-CoA transferase
MDGVEEWSRLLPKAEVQAAFDRCGVPCSPYRTVSEALADPQLAHRAALADVGDVGGSFKVLNPPFRLSEADTGAGAHSPALGEDTQAVLRAAGLTDSAIERLTLR